MHAFLVVFFRWMHVATACLAVGGVFFMRVIVPIGLAPLEDAPRKMVFLRLRRGLKMVIHSAILLFIISGTYNTIANWTAYREIRQSAHPLWGIHVMLALVIFAISLYVLAGKEPPTGHRRWMAVNLMLLATTLAVAAGLKYARDSHARALAAPVEAAGAGSPAAVR